MYVDKSQAQVKGEVTKVGDASHFELRGYSQWNYEVKRLGPDKISLTVPNMDDATKAAFSTWSDSLIKEVNISPGEVDGREVVTFLLHDPTVESFDYLTDEPSRLILDFYRRPEEKKPVTAEIVTESKVKSEKQGQVQAKKRQAQAKKATDEEGYSRRGSGQSRSPAADEILQINKNQSTPSNEATEIKGGAFDASDPNFSRFRIRDFEIRDEAIIASRQNVYIRFPVLKMQISQLPEMLKDLPEFEIKPRDDKENKVARLLLGLYEKQIHKNDVTKDRMGAFLKVYSHFTEKYPDSEYNEIVHHLAAHMHYLRWLSQGDTVDYQTSQTMYRSLLARYPDSPLAERTQLWLAYSQLERGEGLATVQEFQEFLRRHPKTEQRDQINKSIAEGLTILNKFPEAVAVYTEMSKNGQTPLSKVEAAFRIGDVYFQEKNWPEAIKTYQSTKEKFPQMTKIYPNLHYNLAEALFWAGKYKESLESHVQFLSDFPDHSYGGFSMTRVGELLEALGADRSRVIGAFLESYFRYSKSPGAEVARIRMLSQQMKGMKDKELKKAVAEMQQIAKTSPLQTIGEFVVLMVADGYQRRGENDAALKELIDYYQTNPTSGNLPLFKERIVRNIAEKLNNQAQAKDFFKLLKDHATYAKTWLKNTRRLDVRYFVAQAYEQAGVFEEARRGYKQVLEDREKMLGTQQEKEKKVQELLPTVEALRLRLAAVNVMERIYPEAYLQLIKIKNPQNLNSVEQSERISLMAQLHEQREEIAEAKKKLREFIDSWQGDKAITIERKLELAQMNLQSGENVECENLSRQLLSYKTEEGMSPAYRARALELQGRSLLAQKKDLAAVEVFQQLLEEFESTRPLGSIRFKVGEVLFNRGDWAGAEKVWLKLDEQTNGILKKIAQERLASERWQSEHKKYVQRIPAMSGFKEE